MDEYGSVNEWLRLGRSETEIQIRVQEIHWDGPATPVLSWTLVASLPVSAAESEIVEALKHVLTDRRYFGFCIECNEWHLRGHMWEDEICQGCSGVVF